MKVAHDLMGDAFAWRRAPYEYEPAATRPAINLLTGTAEYKRIIEGGGDLRGWIGSVGRGAGPVPQAAGRVPSLFVVPERNFPLLDR